MKFKMNMEIKTLAIAGTSMAILASATAWGASAISVNYDIAGGNTASLATTDIAGVVPVGNWNNLQAPSVGAAFNYAMTYVDDSGANTSLTVAASSGIGDTWNTGGIPDEIIFGDKSDMSNTSTLTLTSVPYATYDLYIYSTEWSSEVVNFDVNGGPVTTLTNTFTPQFTAGTPFVQNDTYVKLSGLSGNSTVNMTATSGGLHLGGFQIVEVPEPSSTLLIALGGIGLLASRRRR
jgi:hypothetical protein